MHRLNQKTQPTIGPKKLRIIEDIHPNSIQPIKQLYIRFTPRFPLSPLLQQPHSFH
ncbi:hypothetical protein Hanom_Chr07g00655051 [Helianthus anomalus]